MNSKPNFFVVGAPKSGTTSLYAYLSQHPDVFLPAKKELHYFSHQELLANCGGPGDSYVAESATSTEKRYRRHYGKWSGEKLLGDFSTSYLFYHDESAGRIRDYSPNAKIVIMLRNPIDKAYSQYMHLVRANREKLCFRAALDAERSRSANRWADVWLYLSSTLYCSGIRRFHEVFGREHVHLVIFEDFVGNTSSVMYRLCEFLGVETSFKFETSRVHNVSGLPRSKLMASIFLGSNLTNSLLRKIIPHSVGSRAREFVQRLNTGDTPEMTVSDRNFLRDYFISDVRQLEREFVQGQVPWSDFSSG